MPRGGKHSVSDVGENARTGPVQGSEPKLAKRRMNRKSTLLSGRTIGEKRERMETKNERAAARKKDKQKAARRFLFTFIGFILFGVVVILVIVNLVTPADDSLPTTTESTESATSHAPTIEIVDEDASASEGRITSRMITFIGEAEQDFRDLGYSPIKAVIPTGSIREVDFYLDGVAGFIKMTIDRGSAVSVEDADRLIRYLAGQGTTEFQYLDVRLSGRAFWK